MAAIFAGDSVGSVRIQRPFSEAHQNCDGIYITCRFKGPWCLIQPDLFWSIHLTTDTHPRTRLQNFNMPCSGSRDREYESTIYLRYLGIDYTEAELFAETVTFEVHLEGDDGFSGIWAPFMVGSSPSE